MNCTSYPAARVVATRIEALIEQTPIAFSQAGDAPRPPHSAMEEIITVAFWASLLREEGRTPKISLAYLPPEATDQPLLFGASLSLAPKVLAHLAPAVERPGIHLGVWGRPDGELRVWGSARQLPPWCFVLEVVSPGLLVVKYRRPDPHAKFANLVVLEGDELRYLEPNTGAEKEDVPSALRGLLSFYTSAGAFESEDFLIRLAISMRTHGCGGLLLVVPQDSVTWRDSIVEPIGYSVDPPYRVVSELLSRPGLASSSAPAELEQAVALIGGLTAVDGATIISESFDLLAFGAKIKRRSGSQAVREALLTAPAHGAAHLEIDTATLGGTRHLSAAQFVHDQPDSVALVASQDGRFTVFAWSPRHGKVHAHRLESLLL